MGNPRGAYTAGGRNGHGRSKYELDMRNRSGQGRINGIGDILCMGRVRWHHHQGSFVALFFPFFSGIGRCPALGLLRSAYLLTSLRLTTASGLDSGIEID